MKKVFVLIVGIFLTVSCALADNIQVNIYSNGSSNGDRYSNNNYSSSKRPRLKYRGVWVESTSGVYYSHSKSKLKSAKHAERINYYNSMYD